jgi:ABC-type antimicrobial peptide transport system permease subunit
MKFLRRLHLYLGCFFAPLLLFFIATGWYQTLQVDRQKRRGEAETWIDKVTSVHKDQIFPTESAMSYNTMLFKCLVVAMSVALIATIIIGIVLAFKILRLRWPVYLSLVLGVALPILLLWLGQKRGVGL